MEAESRDAGVQWKRKTGMLEEGFEEDGDDTEFNGHDNFDDGEIL